jgi:FMN phosphatase YigB (HAD superfamily)
MSPKAVIFDFGGVSGEADTTAGPLAEVSDYLDVVIESSEVGLRKPDTAI